jgi:hypothetical protein
MNRLKAGKRYIYLLLIVLATAGAGAGARSAFSGNLPEPFISYRLSAADYRLNLLEVRLSYSCSREHSVTLQRPGNPGLDPLNMKAFSTDGGPVEVRSSDSGWTVFNDGDDFVLEYQVILSGEDRYSPLVRKKLSLLEEDRFRLMGIDIFLVPENPVSDGVLIDYHIGGSGEIHSAHRSAGRRMILESSSMLGSILCVSGDYRRRTAVIGSTEIIFMLSRGWSFGADEIFELIKDIVVHETGMFGSSPYDRYLFVCDRNPVQGDGGFDYYGVHQGANMLLLFDPRMKRSDLFNLNMAVISHEFFHNWNGEALRPATDRFLWFSEGVTVYYSYQVLISTGIIDERMYRRKFEAVRRSFSENRYRSTVPIAAAGNINMADKDMVKLLYDGGFLAASALDEHLGEISGGECSLLCVLRSLYRNRSFGSAIDESDIIAEVKALTGRDISGFLRELVHTPGSPQINVEGKGTAGPA